MCEGCKKELTTEAEARIREIVREEMAAHREQPEEPVYLSVEHEQLSKLRF